MDGGDGDVSDADREPSILVIDRDAFGLELAREWVKTGMPRNPAV